MKLNVFLLIISVTCEVNTFSQSFHSNALRKAFLNISEALSQNNFDVAVISEDVITCKTNLAFALSTAGIPHVTGKFGNRSEVYLETSAIVFLGSMASLRRFNVNLHVPVTFALSRQIYIHCWHGTIEDIKILRTIAMKEPLLHYEYFVVEEKKSIRILTFLWYTQEMCHVPQLVEVNKFDKSTGKWKHGIFRIDKFSHFHGCQIHFLFEGGMPEFNPDEIDHKKRAITRCSGYTCAFVKDFSSSLNYTFHMNMMYNGETLFPEIVFHLFVACRSLSSNKRYEKDKFSVVTRPIYFVEQFFAIPPGELLNGYEKMVLPFDEETWMWIVITFAAAFATIFVMKFVRREIANFVMGRNTKTPVLNLIRAFFGISQITCPRRNFARYLLMMFILFSLIIRTAYQGVMFTYLQKEIRKPTVTSVEDMIDQNFTFYMPREFLKIYNKTDLAKRGNVIDDWVMQDWYGAYERTYTPGSKTAVFYKADAFNIIIREKVNRSQAPTLLKKRFMLESRGLNIRQYSFFSEIFDRKLQQYFEGDLVNYNTRQFQDWNNPKKYEEYKEPFAVLTLSELEAGFVVSLVPLAFSVLVFAFEWMPTLRILVVFMFVSKKYYELKNFKQEKRLLVTKKALFGVLLSRMDA